MSFMFRNKISCVVCLRRSRQWTELRRRRKRQTVCGFRRVLDERRTKRYWIGEAIFEAHWIQAQFRCWAGWWLVQRPRKSIRTTRSGKQKCIQIERHRLRVALSLLWRKVGSHSHRSEETSRAFVSTIFISELVGLISELWIGIPNFLRRKTIGLAFLRLSGIFRSISSYFSRDSFGQIVVVFFFLRFTVCLTRKCFPFRSEEYEFVEKRFLVLYFLVNFLWFIYIFSLWDFRWVRKWGVEATATARHRREDTAAEGVEALALGLGMEVAVGVF